MGRNGYLLRQLLLVAAAASLPLLLLVAYNIHDSAQVARRQALEVVGNHAITVARDVEDWLATTEAYLTHVTTLPSVQSLDPAHCDPILGGVTQRRTHFANVLVLDRSGRVICTSIDGPGQIPPSMAEMPWVAAALASERAVVSRPYLAPIARKTVVAMALALRDEQGRPAGVAAVLLDLDSLQRGWQRLRLPPGSRLSVVDDDGTMIASAPDFERWVGKDVGPTIRSALQNHPDGRGSAVGIDGVERTFARQPIPGRRWSAFAALPTSDVLAVHRSELRRSVVVAALAATLAVLLVVLRVRRLLAPLRSLSAAADAVREGDMNARADPTAPGELGAVAAAFNAMLEALDRTRAAVRATQRQYADLFANIRMLSLITDRHGRITEVNEFLLDATGRTRGELVAGDVALLLPSDDIGRPAVTRAAAGASRFMDVTEGPVVTRDGRQLIVRWHHSLLRDEADQVIGVASLGEDVTQARQAALREGRLLALYAALSRTNNALLRIGNEVELFDEICRICVEHGHASIAYISIVADDALARPVAWAGPAQRFLAGRDLPLDPEHPEGRGVSATAIRSGYRFIVDDADTHPSTLPWRSLSEAIGTRSLAAFPFRRGGRVAGALTLHMTVPGFFEDQVVALLDEMVEDLTFALDHLDRVEHLRRVQQTVLDREQQLAGLVQTAMDAIITIGADRRIVLFNDAAVAMFSVPAAQAVGGALDRFIPTRLHEVHRRHVSAFASTGSTARRMGVLHTLTGVRADGEEFPIEASISKWGDGDAALMTVVIRDATELRRAEEARLARTAAESANRAKSEFLSRMSHELRTPLNAIIGFSQLLQAPDAANLRPIQAEQVEYIRQAGWHLLALISDVLDVSRIEAGQMRVEARAIDARAALSEAIELVKGVVSQNRLTLDARLDESGVGISVHADPTRLRQVLLNLLSNAAKYNRQGGRIEVHLRLDGQHACFIIADTGLGMTALQLQHLYEPFNRLGRERGAIEGTGLGLALTRQLVALMDGRLDVRSEPERGTQVEVCLPMATPHAGGVASIGSEMAADEPQGTVLYVEDNPVNRLLVEQLLARWPRVALLQAEDGASGVEMARTSGPDIVLLDMQLPDMSGLDVLRALRADPATRDLRVIGLSGDAMPEDLARARDAGVDDYWTKPFDFARFLHGLALWLPRERDEPERSTATSEVPG